MLWFLSGTSPRPHSLRPRRLGSIACAIVLTLVAALAVSIPTAAPAAAASTTPALPSGDNGVKWVNYYRAMAKLRPLTERSAMTAGATAHAEYLVRQPDLVRAAGTPHTESVPPGTTAGRAAAQGNIVRSSVAGKSHRDSVENLMAAPFHALSMLTPYRNTVGVGAYDDINASSSVRHSYVVDNVSGPAINAPSGTFPLVWPANGTTVPMTSYAGTESPDPLPACRGYANPVGLPLVIQYASAPRVSSASLKVNGKAVPHCIVESSDFAPRSTQQRNLTAANAIFVIPRSPFPAGAQVQLVVNSNQPRVSSTFRSYERPKPPALRSKRAGAGAISLTWQKSTNLGGGWMTGHQIEARLVGTTESFTSTVSGSATSGTISGLPSGTYRVTVHAVTNFGSSRKFVGETQFYDVAVVGGNSDFHAITPARLLDTRTGTGAPRAALGTGGSLDLQVTGRGGVPSSGVSAVILNVTSTASNRSSSLTVYPAGGKKPSGASLNFSTRENLNSPVTTRVSPDGRVRITNATGSTHVVADVVGWFDTNGSGSEFVPVVPTRLLDTRTGVGFRGAVGANQRKTLQVTGKAGLPRSGVSAVVMNVTVTGPTASSWMRVWPAGAREPNTSNLNFVRGETRGALVTVKVGAGGRVDLRNSAGAAHFVADVVGWYTTEGSSSGSSFHPLDATRVLDTRSGVGARRAKLGTNGVINLNLDGVGGVPTWGVTAVALNLTVTQASASSYMTVWPSNEKMPLASALNFVPGKYVNNQVIVKVSPDGRVRLFNRSGSTHVIADVVGWYS